jgi:hypothetical protein
MGFDCLGAIRTVSMISYFSKNSKTTLKTSGEDAKLHSKRVGKM